MADVVGTAYVRIRGITTEMGGDVQDAADRAGRDTDWSSVTRGLRRSFDDPDLHKDINRKLTRGIRKGTKDVDIDRNVFTRLRRRISESLFGRIFSRESRAKFQKAFRSVTALLSSFSLPPIAWLVILAVPVVIGAVKVIIFYLGALVGQLGFLLTATVGLGAALIGVIGGLAPALLPLLLAFKTETPALEAFKKEIKGQAEAWKEVGKATQENLLPALANSFRTLDRMRPLFTSLGRRLGGAVGQMAELATAALTSEKNMSAWGRIFSGTSQLVDLFGKAIVKIADVMPRFLAAVMPLAVRFMTSLSEGLQNFFDFIDRGIADTSLTSKLDEWYGRAESFGRGLRDFVIGLWNLFTVAADASEPMMANFETFGADFRAFTDSLAGRNKLREWFDDAVEVAQEVNGLIADIVRMMIPSGGGEDPIYGANLETSGTMKFLRFMREDLLPVIKSLLDSIGEQTGDALLSLAQAFTEFLGAFAESGGLGKSLDLLVRLFEAMTEFFSSDIGAKVANFAGTMLAIGTAFKVVSIFSGPLTLTLQALWAVLGFLVTPLGLVILGVVALAAAAWLLWRNWDTVVAWFEENIYPIYEEHFKPTFDGIKETVTEAFEEITRIWEDVLKPAFSEIKDQVVEVFGKLSDWWDEHGSVVIAEIKEMAGVIWDYLVAAFKVLLLAWKITLIPLMVVVQALAWVWRAAGDQIIDVVKGVWDLIVFWFTFLWNLLKEFMRFLTAVFTGQWGDAWQSIQEIFELVLNFIIGFPQKIMVILWRLVRLVARVFSQLAQNLWNWIKDAIPAALRWLGSFFTQILTSIAGFHLKIVDAFLGFVSAAWEWIIEAKNTIVEKLGEVWDAILQWTVDTAIALGNALIGFSTAVWDWITGFIGGFRDRIVGAISAATDWVGDATGTMLANLGEFGSKVWGWITGFIGDFTDKISGAIEAATDWVKEAATTVIANFGDFAVDIWNWIGQFGLDIWDKFLEAIEGIGEIGTKIIDFIVGGLKDGLSKVLEWGGDLLRTIRDGLIDKAPGFLQGPLRGLFRGKKVTEEEVVSAAGGVMPSSRRSGSVVADRIEQEVSASRRSSSAGVSLLVKIGDRDITEIVDARVLEDNLDIAHALFVRRK